MWPFADEVNDWFDEIRTNKEQSAQDNRTQVPMEKNEDPRLARLKALKTGKPIRG
jgi:hypothetical protein